LSRVSFFQKNVENPISDGRHLGNVSVVPNPRWRPHTGSSYILAYRHDRKKIKTANPMFFTSPSSYKLPAMQQYVTGRRISKMAAANPKLHISWLIVHVEMIEKIYISVGSFVMEVRDGCHFYQKNVENPISYSRHLGNVSVVPNPRWRPPIRNFIYIGL